MKRKMKVLFIILIALMILPAAILVPSYAKYAGSAAWNYYLQSKGFYFNSDILSKNNINTNWDGEEVHFDIKNSDSSLLASGYDINYKVTCNIKNDINARCLLNNTNSNIFTGKLSSYEECTDLKKIDNVSSYDYNTCVNNGYEYRNKETIKDMYFDIVSDSDINSAVVEVIVESTYPYKKTIKGNFTLNKGLDAIGNVSLTYNEYDDYSRVIVNNTFSESKCMKLSWDSRDVRIDTENIINYTDDDEGYVKNIKFNIDADSYKNYIFYRVNKENNYNGDNFTLLEDNEC